MACTVPLDTWHARIQAARERRDVFLSLWSFYASLHTNAYLAAKAKNDDALVTLPNGDQVKIGLIFRNIEQTLALLEVPEIGVRAQALDYTYELSAADTHRESVVEQALWRSLIRSGLVARTEECDPVKRDGIIIGHGIAYSWWRLVQAEIDAAPIPVFGDDGTGQFVPMLDDAGQPLTERRTELETLYEGVQDEHISPTEFLFDAAARDMRKSPWHGFERVVKLDTLRQDPRYTIPHDVEPTAFKTTDLYGNEVPENHTEKDSVKIIIIYDKTNRELIHLIEGGSTKPQPRKFGQKSSSHSALALNEILTSRRPVRFDHPDDSPFSFFIPIPANDLPWGISQIEHTRTLATEADKIRTRQANQTRQAKRIPWYRKGRVDPVQLQQALRSPDMTPVGLDIQENEDPKHLLGELPMPTITAELYQAYKVIEDDIRKTSGQSEIPFGGAETATESENMMAVGGARPNRKKRFYLSFLSAVAEIHKCFLREFAPSGQIITVPSLEGAEVTLAYGREAFQGDFDIRVIPGGGASAISPVRQKLMQELLPQLMGKFGPRFDLGMLRQILTIGDFRDINQLMRAAATGAGQLPGAPGQVPAPGFELGNYSNGQAIRSAANAITEG